MSFWRWNLEGDSREMRRGCSEAGEIRPSISLPCYDAKEIEREREIRERLIDLSSIISAYTCSFLFLQVQ